MNVRFLLLGLAMLAVLCACGQGPKPKPAQSPSRSPCQADSVTPLIHPLIEISPASAATPSAVATQVRLACGTTLSVTREGSATATFGIVAACTLSQGHGPAGMLISRYPADVLFSLDEGEVWCRNRTTQKQEIAVCGQGLVTLTIPAEWTSTCASDHVFRVAVYSGTVLVRYPNGSTSLGPSRQVAFDPRTGRPLISAIIFSTADVSTLNALDL